jgi:acyl carrier protein
MSIENRLKTVLEEALQLQGKTASWTSETPLLGSLPELDSLAVVEVIAGIEKTFGFRIEDEDINADMMATLQSLTQFIEQKLKDKAT